MSKKKSRTPPKKGGVRQEYGIKYIQRFPLKAGVVLS
jgi:hypothetical protein